MADEESSKVALLFPAPTDPTKIGQLEVDVLVSSELTYASEVTENPVEDGFPVHDHVICKPLQLSMVVVVSPLPVTWYEKFGVDTGRMDDAIAKLEQIYKDRQPITIITNEKTYEDMVMTECKINKAKEDGKILRIPLEFKQIRKVEVKTADIPEEYVDALTSGKVGSTEEDVGAAATDDIGSGSGSASANSAADESSTGDSSGSDPASKNQSILAGVFH
nr:hypothetical protein [uncultured Anaeromusa sp.]